MNEMNRLLPSQTQPTYAPEYTLPRPTEFSDPDLALFFSKVIAIACFGAQLLLPYIVERRKMSAKLEFLKKVAVGTIIILTYFGTTAVVGERIDLYNPQNSIDFDLFKGPLILFGISIFHAIVTTCVHHYIPSNRPLVLILRMIIDIAITVFVLFILIKSLI